MKRALTAGIGLLALAAVPAAAADIPVKGPYVAPVMAPVFNWTGCYIGVAGGLAWGRAQNTNLDPAFALARITDNYSLSGGLFGGTVGCNYQVDRFVFGVEGDLSWTNKRGSGRVIPPFLTSSVADTKESWIGTVRGRIGYVFADRWLVYATGGLAATKATLNISDPVFGVNVSESQNRVGWTIGGGLETALTRNWSAKAEYLYADYGSIGYFNPSRPVGTQYILLNQSVRLTDHIFRVGINYRFGYDAIVARY